MKTVLITGGTQGIGRGIAERFAAEGYFLGLLYRADDESANATQKYLLENTACAGVYLAKADVSDEAAVKKAIGGFLSAVKHIDVLVNNAGVDSYSLLMDTSLEEWNRVFSVNVTGTFLCTREVLASMIASGKGSIVNVSSVWGEVGASCECAYSASKGAVIALTKALSKEVAPSGIRVNCVSPGVIETRMNAHYSEEERQELTEEIQLGRIGLPSEVAEAVYFVAEKATYMTGQDIAIGGGFGF